MEDRKCSINITIMPVDTLFFRDRMPFEKELSFEVPSLKTPYPSTIYGSLFSFMLRKGVFPDALETIKKGQLPDMKERLAIERTCLYSHGRKWLPAPMDVFYNTNSVKVACYKKVQINETEYFYGCEPPDENSYGKYQNASEIYLSELGYQRYMAGEPIDRNMIKHENELFVVGDKIGIEIDRKRRSTKEKHLYRIEQISFIDKEAKYIVHATYESDKKGVEIQDGERSVLQFGGERKMAYVRFLREKNDILNIPTVSKTQSMKMILTTPMTVSTLHTLERYIDETSNMSVRGCISDIPIPTGGYDMVRNQSKKLQSILPAGSILIIKGYQDDDVESFFMKIKNKIYDMEDTYKGYNQFVLAPFQDEEG